MKTAMKPIIAIASFLFPLVLGAWLGHDSFVLLLPAAMNAAVAGIFLASLFGEESLVQKFARLQKVTITPEIAWYCRWASRYWVFMLIVNTIIAAWTALDASLETWLWYNGAFSYVLLAVTFGIEYIARVIYRSRLKSESLDHAH